MRPPAGDPPPISLARRPGGRLGRLLDRLRDSLADGLAARARAAEPPEPRGVVVPLVRPEDAAEWKGLDDFLAGLLDLLRGLFDFHSAHVFLASDDGRSLVQRAYTARGEEPCRLAAIRVGTGLVGWVAERGRAISVGDLRQGGRPTGYARRDPIVSFAAAPIVAGGKTLGVLAVDHVAPDAFPSPRTEAALAAVAAQVGRILAAEGALAEARAAAAAAAAAAALVEPVAAAEDLDSAAEALVAAVARAAETTAAGCFLLDEAGVPNLRAHVGWNDLWGANIRRRAAAKFAEGAASLGRPVRFGHALSRTPTGIAVPIPRPSPADGGAPRAVGAVVVEASEEALKVVEPILLGAAAPLGVAFVRIYRRLEAEREAARARRLADDLLRLAAAETPAAFWSIAAGVLAERLGGAPSLAAFRRTPEGWRLEAAEGAEAAATTLRSGEGLVGWAAATGRAVAVEDLAEETRGVPVEGAGSVLLVPIGRSGGRADVEAVAVLAGPRGAFDARAAAAVEDLRAPLAALHRRLPPAEAAPARATRAA